MKDICFDEGTIQAFTDGELSSDLTKKVIKHVAVCDTCADLLAGIEQESAFAFRMLESGLNITVPTERLRARVFDSIGELEERSQRGILGGLFAFARLYFRTGFGTGSALVAASALVFISFFGLYLGFFSGVDTQDTVAGNAGSDRTAVTNRTSLPDTSRATPPAPSVPGGDASADGSVAPNVIRASKRRNRTRGIRKAVYREPEGSKNNTAAKLAAATITSEHNYLQTIATLDKTVETSKQFLQTDERVAFERDLAIVDDAIRKMKSEVRRNPDNLAAREVLRASYQNKIELLNSTAEKTELMASLR